VPLGLQTLDAYARRLLDSKHSTEAAVNAFLGTSVARTEEG